MTRAFMAACCPSVLQGAFIGAFIVLPIGWIVSVVRAGVPRLREGSPRRAVYQAVALATCLGLVLSSISCERRRSSAASKGGSAQSTEARLAALENSLRAIEDGDRQTPRDSRDPDYVVQTMGRDSQLTSEQAAELLPTLMVPSHPDSTRPPGDRLASSTATASLVAAARGDIQNVAARYRLDQSAIERTTVAQEDALTRLQSDLDTRVLDQTHRLLAAVPRSEATEDWNRRLDAVRAALRDHWWVQQDDGRQWVDFDLLDRARGSIVGASHENDGCQ